MRAAERDLIAFYELVAREEHVEVQWRQTARTEFVPFSTEVQERVAAAAAARGLPLQHIISGAGHDAQEMAHVCTAGMVFVPGEYDGISHNPREYSTKEQCGNGVDVLLDVVLQFAD
jgi:N-carbamoyl-L-amino-acid hydrolase